MWFQKCKGRNNSKNWKILRKWLHNTKKNTNMPSPANSYFFQKRSVTYLIFFSFFTFTRLLFIIQSNNFTLFLSMLPHKSVHFPRNSYQNQLYHWKTFFFAVCSNKMIRLLLSLISNGSTKKRSQKNYTSMFSCFPQVKSEKFLFFLISNMSLNTKT